MVFKTKNWINIFLDSENSKWRFIKGLGALFIFLLILVTSFSLHIKATHRGKINSLEAVIYDIKYVYLNTEGVKAEKFLVHREKEKSNLANARGLLKNLLGIKWDDYVIPLTTKKDRKEIESIINKLQELEKLINIKTKSESTESQAVFNSLINRVINLQEHLKKRLEKQISTLYLFQTILLLVLFGIIIFILIILNKNRISKQNILLEQQRLLERLKQTNFILQKSQEFAKIGHYSYEFETKKWIASKAILDLGGFKPDEHKLQAWIDIIHPEDKHILTDILDKRLKYPDVKLDVVYRIINKSNGQIRWVHHVTQAIKDKTRYSNKPIIGVIQDITEHVELNSQLVKSEKNLLKAQELALLGTYTYDLKTKIISDRSCILCKISGLKPQSLKTLDDWHSVLHPDDIEISKNIVAQAIKTSEKFELVYRIIARDTQQVKWIRSMGQIIREGGIPISIFGSIQDITKQKITDLALEKSHQKFKRLFQQNPIALWEEDYSKVMQLLDDKKKEVNDLEAYLENNPDFVLECVASGKILNANKTVLDLFEVKDKQALIDYLNNGFNDELLSIYRKGLLAISSNEKTFSNHVNFITSSGKVINTFLKVVLLDGESRGKVIFTIIDITERKLAEEALKESHEKLEEAIQTTGLGTFTFYDATRTFETSPLLDRVVGIDKSFKRDVNGWINLAHPEDYEQVKFFFDESKQVEMSHEFRIVRPEDKKIIWVFACFKKVFHKGERVLIKGTIQDITERKEVEEKLSRSDAILSKLNSIVLVVDDGGDIIYVSPSIKNILGYEPKAILGQGWWDITFTDKQSANKIKKAAMNHFFKNKPLAVDVSLRKIKTKDGKDKWFSWHISKGFENTYVSIGLDVTEKHEKETQIRTLIETAQAAIILADHKGLIIEWNKGAHQIFGYTKEEILGKSLTALIPEKYIAQHNTAFGRANKSLSLKNKNFMQLEGLSKEGTTFPLEMSLSSWISKGHNVYCAFIIDISERQREAKIKDVIFKISKFANSITNLEKLLPYVRETLQNVIDTTNFFIALYNVKDDSFTIPYRVDEEDINRDDYLKHFKKGKTLSGYVFETKKPFLSTSTMAESLYKKGLIKEGGIKSKCWLGVPLIINDEVIGVMVVQSYTNKNAFKEKEVALLELIAANISQVVRKAQNYKQIRLLNQALIQSPESVVVTNTEGDIEYVNPAFTKLSGYSVEEAIGKNPRILKSGEHPDAFYKKLWDTISQGKMWRGEFINKRKDGSKYLVSATVSAVKNKVGEITHYIGVEEDITKKRQLERDYLNAFIDAQEQEKQSFGEDLHDGISQILSAEGMYIDILLQHENLAPKKVKKYLEKIKEHNLNAVNDARRIAHGLMSKQLKQEGLLKAVAYICEDYNHSRNITFNTFNEAIEEHEINKTIKTNIYRVCQEITTNILRHSGATKASVSFSKTIKNELKLVIEDNGVGIDFDKMKREKRGAGLKNIERRITLLSGKLDLESTLDVGTKFTIIVPLESI